MQLKKYLLSFLLSILSIYFLCAIDFKKIDQLSHDGKYQESLDILIKNVGSKPEASVIWRISREWYFIGDRTKKKDDKKAIFNKGMGILKPFVILKKTGKKKYSVTTKLQGEKIDIAKLSYWYAVNYGSWGEAKGIKESLDIIPALFALSNNAIKIDPTFSGPYLVLAKIDDAVPGFLGGDKFRMGKNFSLAIKSDPKDVPTLVFAAMAFYKRNWNIDKKTSAGDDGTPKNITDREYAKIVATNAVKYYGELTNPSDDETKRYKQAKGLLKKYK